MEDNKRKQPRLPFAATVDIQIGEDSISGSTRDISTTGLYIESEIAPALETPCQLHIILTNGEISHTIKGEGKVIRHIRDGERQGLGIEFVDLDPESLAHLWRVIRRASRDRPDWDRRAYFPSIRILYTGEAADLIGIAAHPGIGPGDGDDLKATTALNRRLQRNGKGRHWSGPIDIRG